MYIKPIRAAIKSMKRIHLATTYFHPIRRMRHDNWSAGSTKAMSVFTDFGVVDLCLTFTTFLHATFTVGCTLPRVYPSSTITGGGSSMSKMIGLSIWMMLT